MRWTPRSSSLLAALVLGGGLVGAAIAAPTATASPSGSAGRAATAATQPAATPSSSRFVPARGLPDPGTEAAGPSRAAATSDPDAPPRALPTAASPAAAQPATSPGTFTPLPPARVLDTRDGTGVAAGRLAPRGTVTVKIAGHGGVPATGAGAVVLTLTATSVTSDGFVTAYPTGGPLPVVSDLNLRPGVTVANLVTVPLGANGAVSLYSGAGAPVDLVADVSGWYRSGTPTAAGTLTAVTPSRVVDTRSGLGTPAAPLSAGATRTVAVVGRGGVPATGVRSVVLNVTVVSPAASGYLTVSPSGVARPTASNLNFVPGQIVAGQVTVPVGADGGVALYLGNGGRADVVVDVQGWVRSGAVLVPGAFRAATPQRLLDTRVDATPEYGYSVVPAGGTVTLDVVRDVPVHAVTAALLTVTVTETHGGGFVTAWPTGGNRPLASNLNFRAADTVPDAAAVAVGPDGSVSFFNGSPGSLELVVDLAGYWLDGSLGAVTGTVTGPGGQALSGVQVFAGDWWTSSDDDGVEQATFRPDAVTDASGRYTADAIDTFTDATVCVSTTRAKPVIGSAGLASGCATHGAVTVVAGQTTTADVALTQPGVAVTGKLVGAAGETLAGVQVQLGRPGESSTQSEPVTTAADGSWRIPGVNPSASVSDLCVGPLAATANAALGYTGQCRYVSAGSAGQVVTLDAGAAVAGRVTDAAGRPLSHVAVTWGLGYDPNGNGTQFVTGSDGAWRVLVDPGTQQQSLQVCFLARSWYQQPIVPAGGASTTGYQDQCWKGLPTSYTGTGSYTPIPLTAGRTTTGIDAALAPAAAISGQVRRPGGTPAAGVNVVLYGGVDVPNVYVRTLTGSDGRYHLDALRPGHYTVCFVPTLGAPLPPPTGLLGQCWHETSPFDSQQVLLGAGSDTTGIDADLNAGGTLTGRVTDAAGNPLTGAVVGIDDGQSTTTGADGVYRFTFVRPLPMRIVVRADGASGGTSPAGYLDTCVGCDTDPLHRSPVPVAVGRTTTYDVPLTAASGIRVRVTDAAGAPVTGAQVDVTLVGSNSGTGVLSGADGSAVVPRLTPGTYSVCVGDGHGATGGSSAGGYLQACFSPAPASYTVQVTVGAATTVDATVQARPAGGVAGRLTDPSGRPVRNAAVQVFGWTQPQDSTTVSSSADGTFSALGLTPGSYSVCTTGGTVDGTTEQLQSICWKDRPNTSGGTDHTPVTLTAGALTSGIDQVLPLQ